MALNTPHLEDRRRRREERLQRERARRRTQIGSAAVVGIVVLAAIAYVVISTMTGSRSAGAGASRTDTGARTPSSVATGSSEPTKSSQPDTPTPAAPTGSATPSSSADATAAIEPLSPAPGIKTIVVNKKAQTVTLYKADGTPVDRFRCASGVQYPRVGTYEVFGKRQQSWSLYDDTTFYYFTKFETSDKGNSIGFHSIPVEPDGTLVGGLGKPVSHGCVRLDKKKAKFIYEWAPIGAKVIVKK
jgi:lipoprotein-anchoring transpeptidase ErfK/SrfK